ncbi:YHS domain-containing protein [Chryseobacterium sp. POL2]|uniref:YHS domain-containing protein n=1 Tax=Chryseobacterium sp. POL2 TaxID=2713414 RepID=UPI0013E1434B|nr:YHS domain-containing protein [Chryseobacterium sp. POL2]QIG88500.1 YHS domain-containing protein [Chryseobacterium sp. POL2]QIG88587.1 YHS domain-containing protein [Chryseobacterium sp. POL2]
MKINILMILLSVSVMSCAQETPKVKQVKKMAPKKEIKGVKVVNSEDPICHMKTAEFLKDTAIYKSKTYGFCSDYCKKEFKKNPAKYVQK